eukprot:TRINITY_DN21078_c0_g1_i1.p1 TRINITY_DN21078_c0_g1~~TRINITY_DN21078_c0_g1_i1.p1  ORF type:complete len:183 (+),score=49.61 TRINITY_DN21078_c0_g1_i1:46-594(+)
MDCSQKALSSVREELKFVTKKILELAEKHGKESFVISFLLSLREELKLKEKELQRERRERKEDLEDKINARAGNLRVLYLEGEFENYSLVMLLKEEKEEFERQLALLWENRLPTGSQQEESLHELGEGLMTKLGKMQAEMEESLHELREGLTKLGGMHAEMMQLLQSKQTLGSNISQPSSEI